MSKKYVSKRILIFLITIILAATINFIIPRLTPQDPIAALIGKMASKGALLGDTDSIVEMYETKFGMDKPLIVQYFQYMYNVLFHFDFGYSLSYYPSEVLPIILNAIPYTLGLLAAAIFWRLSSAICSAHSAPGEKRRSSFAEPSIF